MRLSDTPCWHRPRPARAAGPRRPAHRMPLRPAWLIDFAERTGAARADPGRRFRRRPVYVSELRPGATFDFKPVTREFTDGMRAEARTSSAATSNGKPGWFNSPVGLHPRLRRGVADAPTALRLHGAAGDRRRPDLLQRRRTDRRQDLGTAGRQLVSRDQLRAGRRADRGIRQQPGVRVGRRRRGDRALDDTGEAVGPNGRPRHGRAGHWNRRRCCIRPRWSPHRIRAR